MKKYLKKQDGQGMMEYVILTGLVGIFCLVAVKEYGQVLQKRLEQMKTKIVRNLKIQ